MIARHNNPPVIAHVIYALTAGGLENGLVNIINRIPSNKYRHVLVCITEADEFAGRISAENVKIIELHKRAGHDLSFFLRLWRLFWELRPDIIHSRNLAALETQFLSIGLPGVKRVHGEHGREITDLDGTNPRYLMLRRCLRAIIHRYIAVSKDLEAWLKCQVRVDERNVRQIYNGVDHERFLPGNVGFSSLLPAHWQGLDDIIVVGTVGRLTPVKDQQLLLRAAALLRDLDGDLFRRLRVMLVGDGPLRVELAALVQELDLVNVAWLAGNCEEVPELLRCMDIFVLPSLAEGISNTVLEAMSAGLPVIATAVGGNLELVEPGFNGALVPVGDAAALTRALVPLLANEQERHRLGANARQWVCQRFDWDRTVEEYLEVYDSLLQLPSPNQTMEENG